jgi:hypothetical protein
LTAFMEKGSFGSDPSKNRRAVLRKVSIASKTSPDPVVLAQPNMLTQFVRYWPMIHAFHKNWLLAFWAFTKVQSNVFHLKVSRSEKSISNEFLIRWTMIKNWKGFDSQRSSWNSSSQSRNVRLQMNIKYTKRGFIATICDR